jgi:hypothetical protein
MAGLHRIASSVLSKIGTATSPLIVAGGISLITGVIAEPPAASALPSFARQTGQPCGACHTGFPQLTPQGREFKLGGYTAGGGMDALPGAPGWIPPISFQAIGSFTHTGAPSDNTGIGGDLSPNNNIIFQEASVWYGGAITNKIGMMFQWDWINPIVGGIDSTTNKPAFGDNRHRFNWDMLDLRYADTVISRDLDLVYGVTFNNQVGIQDVWNSHPAWSFPFVISTLAPMPMAHTLVEGAFTQRVLGTGGYIWLNHWLYLEATGYETMTPGQQNGLGIDPVGAPGTIKDVAPYFRVAMEPKWGPHSLEFGSFAFIPNVIPQPWNFGKGNGTDHYTDIGFDTQYQYEGSNYWLTLRGTYIHEDQNLAASSQLGISNNLANQLNSFKATASFAYGRDNTVVLSGGYFNIWGTPDMGLYMNSPTGRPNSSGWLAELSYIPFGLNNSPIYPWANARVGLQYTWYDEFNGGQVKASDANALFLYMQIAF